MNPEAITNQIMIARLCTKFGWELRSDFEAELRALILAAQTHAPLEVEKENDHGAGLIHQAIPDVDGTLPRLDRQVCHGPHKWGTWERNGANHVRKCRRCPKEQWK
jgi:hypothetical protein